MSGLSVADISTICEAVPQGEQGEVKYALVPAGYVINPPRTYGARWLLVALCFRAGPDGTCNPSLAKLQKDAHMSRPVVLERLGELEAGGYVEVTRGGGGRGNTNRYRLPARAEMVRQPNPKEKARQPNPIDEKASFPRARNTAFPSISEQTNVKKAPTRGAPSKNGKGGGAPEGYQALVDLFFQLFEGKHREKYTAVPRDFAALKTTLKRNPPAVVEAKLRRYFAQALWFNDKGARHTLHGFCDHLAEIIGGNGRAGDDTNTKMIPCPTCGVSFPKGTRCPSCRPAEVSRVS